MPKAPHVQWCKVLFVRRGFGKKPQFLNFLSFKNNVALGGASFFSERSPSGARAEERGDKNREGVASGSAT